MFKNKKIIKENEMFYRLDKLHKEAPEANVYIIAAEKGNGKSYAVKEHALNMWRDSGKKFVYLRRFDSDCTASKLERIFSDMVNIEEATGGYNFIGAYTGVIYLHHLNHTAPSIKRNSGVPCGYYGSIQKIIKSYSSIPFPEVDMVILDEVSQIDGAYLPNEGFLFDVCLSTILRRNSKAKIYIVGNTWDRNCPYYAKYGVDVTVLQQDTITKYVKQNNDGTLVNIAVERCKDLEANNNPLIVTGRESIIEGKWFEDSYSILNNPEEYNSVYKFYIQSDVRSYECRYLVKGLDSVVYVKEYDEAEFPNRSRVISKNVSTNAFYTPKLAPLTPDESLIFNFIKIGKIMFSDNLTGTEFNRIIKSFI